MLSPAILEALSIGSLPEITWSNQDDLCDCTYQRIGMWKNPYLAETHEIRLCCAWAEMAKQFPGLVRTSPGYFDENTKQWLTEPREWDGETEMPAAIWHRHLARKHGVTVADARAMGLPAPKGKGAAVPFILLVGGTEVTVNLAKMRRR